MLSNFTQTCPNPLCNIRPLTSFLSPNARGGRGRGVFLSLLFASVSSYAPNLKSNRLYLTSRSHLDLESVMIIRKHQESTF